MATNINRVRLIKNVGNGPWGQAYLEAADVTRLLTILGEDAPEGCFLHDFNVERAEGGKLKLTSLQWQGECSGRSFDFFESEVVPAIKGEVVALVTWECGDTTEIWHIKDGDLVQTDVMNVLKDPDILSACLK
jgi:hypothetical protein